MSSSNSNFKSFKFKQWLSRFHSTPKLLRAAVFIAASLVLITAAFLKLEKRKDTFSSDELSEVLGNADDYDSNANPLEIKSPMVNFASEIVPIREYTSVKIPIIPPKEFGILWLSVFTETGYRTINVLMYHPVLFNLDWPVLKNREYSLYQREPTYQSIEEFLANPPVDSQIAADLYIQDEIKSDNLIDIHNITNTEGIDYIITTYHQPYKKDKFTIFETIVDTTHAIITDGNIDWSILGSNIDEINPFYLGEIAIDYKQPAQ